MSVCMIGPEELQSIYSRVLGLPFRTFVDERKIREALASAFVANKAAMAMTYNEDVSIAMRLVEMKDSAIFHNQFLKLYEDIGHLLYNCISNGGRDFLPAGDRQVLRNVQDAIARSAMEKLQVPPEPALRSEQKWALSKFPGGENSYLDADNDVWLLGMKFNLDRIPNSDLFWYLVESMRGHFTTMEVSYG